MVVSSAVDEGAREGMGSFGEGLADFDLPLRGLQQPAEGPCPCHNLPLDFFLSCAFSSFVFLSFFSSSAFCLFLLAFSSTGRSTTRARPTPNEPGTSEDLHVVVSTDLFFTTKPAAMYAPALTLLIGGQIQFTGMPNQMYLDA